MTLRTGLIIGAALALILSISDPRWHFVFGGW